MRNIIWRDCNNNCAFWRSEKQDCEVKEWSDLPAIKCYLMHMCKMLRRAEVREDEENDWK